MKLQSWMVTAPAGLIAIVTLLADKGESLLGVLKFLQAWTATLPLGVWSFWASLVLALLIWHKAITRLPLNPTGSRPHVSAEFLAWAVAIAVTVGQQAFASTGRGEILQALISGSIAGMVAPFVGKLIQAAVNIRSEAP